MDGSISYFLRRQTQEKCCCSPARQSFPFDSFPFIFNAPLFSPPQLSSFLPLDLEFGCLVVYLDSFLPLPIPLGRRRRCSRWSLSNGERAQPVSDERSAWLHRLQAAFPRTDICSAEPSQALPGCLERAKDGTMKRVDFWDLRAHVELEFSL